MGSKAHWNLAKVGPVRLAGNGHGLPFLGQGQGWKEAASPGRSLTNLSMGLGHPLAPA